MTMSQIPGLDLFELHQGNCLEQLATIAPKSVQAIVTSSPYYGMRNYHSDPVEWPSVEYAPVPGASPFVIPPMVCDLGLESTPEAFIGHLILIYRAARGVLRDDGSMWLNLADTFWGGKGRSGFEKPHKAEERHQAGKTLQRGHYVPGSGSSSGTSGEETEDKDKDAVEPQEERIQEMRPQDGYHPHLKPKDMVLLPQRLALALQADGWFVRADVPWLKDNGMPSSADDRPAVYHETFLLLTKRANYYYDYHAVRLPAKASSLKRLKRGRGADQKYSTSEYGQPVHTLHSYKPHNPNQPISESQQLRHRRTTDWWYASIEVMIEQTLTRLNWLERFLPTSAQEESVATGGGNPKSKSRGKHPTDARGGLLCLPLADYNNSSVLNAATEANVSASEFVSVAPVLEPSLVSGAEAGAGEEVGEDGLGPVALLCNPNNSKTSHYATFPAALVKPCVVSSTAPMACEHCGSPWRRHLQQTESDWANRKKLGEPGRLGLHSATQHGVGNFKLREVLGESWQPGCECEGNAGSGKCVVLDPFAGSGTVLEVAVQEGRYAIGIELNADYCEIIRQRVSATQPPLPLPQPFLPLARPPASAHSMSVSNRTGSESSKMGDDDDRTTSASLEQTELAW